MNLLLWCWSWGDVGGRRLTAGSEGQVTIFRLYMSFMCKMPSFKWLPEIQPFAGRLLKPFGKKKQTKELVSLLLENVDFPSYQPSSLPL